jgi:hypothetical protein
MLSLDELAFGGCWSDDPNHLDNIVIVLVFLGL